MYSRDLVEDMTTHPLLEVICKTSISPPTKIMWMCDEELVNTDGTDFVHYQVVTNQQNVHYDNILVVMNVKYALGRHDYTCIITNSQGNTTATITTCIAGITTSLHTVC